jgi:aspartate/methionine/tyrosine aminotransferase
LTLNTLAKVRSETDGPVIDLTESNPTRCGFSYPADLLHELAHSRGLGYAPDPRGLRDARLAVARNYERSGATLSPEQILLTASTSEAYSFLFKLVADPGDTVLVPAPSYPLFDHLARLDAIRPVAYPLRPDEGWRPDLPVVPTDDDSWRGMIVVHPNNPTGSYVQPDAAAAIVERCAREGRSLIVDEVFHPYPLDQGGPPRQSFSATSSCLTFTLGGLSKSIGMPQAKLAWIVVSGPELEVEEAIERLDYISDAYLSVSTPIAGAASRLMDRGRTMQQQILTRCRINLRRLEGLVSGSPVVTLDPPEGGWSAVLKVPSILGDETLAIELLRDRSVAVHPGCLFGFPSDGYLVVSLIVPEAPFEDGIRRLLEFVDEMVRKGP